MNKYRRSYLDFKNNQQKLMDDFLDENAFFAFSNKQFQDGLKKLDATIADITQVTNSAFVLESKMEEFHEIIKTLSDNQDKFLKSEDNFLSAMLYEFGNYGLEYNGIKYVLENAFGLTTKDLSKTQRQLLNEAIEMYKEELEINASNNMDEKDRERYLEIYFSNCPDQKELVSHMINKQGSSAYEAVKLSYSCTVEEIGEKLGMEYGDILGFADAMLSFDELCNIDYKEVEKEMKEAMGAEE